MKKGFTLIELLVVIAIIAILAAILFPVFAQAREKARASSCLSNCKQIGTALQLYVDDYDETVPLAVNPTLAYKEWSVITDSTYSGYPCSKFKFQYLSTPGGIFCWQDSIFPYVKNTNMYVCPSGKKDVPGYGFNSCLMGSEPNGTDLSKFGYQLVMADCSANSNTNQQPVSLSQVKNSSEVVFVCDTIQDKTNEYGIFHANPYFINGDTFINDTTNKWARADRHNEGLNFCMLDGHAKYYKRRGKGPCLQGNPNNGYGNITRYWDPLNPTVDYDTWTVTW